jgi:hypothetical protein
VALRERLRSLLRDVREPPGADGRAVACGADAGRAPNEALRAEAQAAAEQAATCAAAALTQHGYEGAGRTASAAMMDFVERTLARRDRAL